MTLTCPGVSQPRPSISMLLTAGFGSFRKTMSLKPKKLSLKLGDGEQVCLRSCLDSFTCALPLTFVNRGWKGHLDPARFWETNSASPLVPFGSSPGGDQPVCLPPENPSCPETRGVKIGALHQFCGGFARHASGLLWTSFLDFKNGVARPPGNFTNSMVTPNLSNRICEAGSFSDGHQLTNKNQSVWRRWT